MQGVTVKVYCRPLLIRRHRSGDDRWLDARDGVTPDVTSGQPRDFCVTRVMSTSIFSYLLNCNSVVFRCLLSLSSQLLPLLLLLLLLLVVVLLLCYCCSRLFWLSSKYQLTNYNLLLLIFFWILLMFILINLYFSHCGFVGLTLF